MRGGAWLKWRLIFSTLAPSLLACATPQRYPLAGHPGWTLQESAIPLTGIPDEPPEACGFRMPSQEKGPPGAPCGMTDATTSCETKTVTVWWYSRPGALDHEMKHVEACR